MNTETSTATTGMIVEAKPALADSRRVNVRRMVRRHLPVMLLVFAAIALPGLLYVYRRVPLEYTATAEVRFLASTPRVMENTNPSDFIVPYEKFLNTQVGLITGNTILSRILEDPEVRALKFVAVQKDPLPLLKTIIKAGAEQESEIVKLSCTHPDRNAAKLLVEKTLSAYMNYALAEEADIGGERLRVLMKERDSRQQELDSQLKRMNELQQELGMPLESVAEMGSGEVRPYREMLARAEEDLLQSGSRADLLRENLARIGQLRGQLATHPEQPVFDFGVEDIVTTDARVSAMRQEAAKAEVAYKTLADRYTDDSPNLAGERETFNAAGKRKEQIEREVRGEVLASTRSKIEEELAVAEKLVEDARQRKQKFESMISGIEKRALTASKTIAELDELKLRAEETRSLLRQVRDQITSIGVESNAPARVKLASPAMVPLNPHGGRRMQLAFLTVIFAISMSMGMGFALELTDQQVRGPHDVAAVTMFPILAAVPHASVEGLRKNEPLAMVAAERRTSAMANEFRRLVARLAYSDIDLVEVNSCLVTSPTAGDGKTIVACNLALALAEANRRVLLLDTAPGHRIESIYGLEAGPGLSESLLGEYELRKLVRSTSFDNLSVMGAGLDSGLLSTKLASREMVELLEQCERLFDHVIIDTPPTLLFSDAKCLAPIVAGVALVVGARKSTSGMVRRAVADLTQTGSTLLGVVVNGIKPSWDEYLARKLMLFYGNKFGRGSASSDISDLVMETTDAGTADEKPVNAPQQQ